MTQQNQSEMLQTTEVAALKNALNQQKSLHTIIYDNIPMMMVRVNREGRILNVNTATAEAVGHERSELVGLLGGELIRCVNSFVGDGCGQGEACKTCTLRSAVMKTFEDRQGVQNIVGTFSSKTNGTSETYHYLISTTFLPVRDGEQVLVMLDDITVQKRETDELEKQAYNLESVIENRAKAYRQAEERLEQELLERTRLNDLLQGRARLLEYAGNHTLDDLLEETLNTLELLTDSQMSFYHFVDPDQVSLILQNWSTRTKRLYCSAEGKGSHYNIADAGVWVESFHQRRPVIHNDYESLKSKKGLPPGHAKVKRELVVPVLRENKVVAILGVGNKPREYSDNDVSLVSTFADLAWDMAERKRTESILIQKQKAIELYNRVANVFLTTSSHLIYKEVLKLLMTAFESPAGAFGYVDEFGALVYPAAKFDIEKEGVDEETPFVVPESAWCADWGRSLLEKKTHIVQDGIELPGGDGHLKRALITPIVQGKRLVGQFVVANKDHDYADQERNLLENVAAQTAPILSAILEERRQEQERHLLEEQLRQSQKMDAIGRLAGGIAHDFNNLLTVINGYAELAQDEFDNPIRLKYCIDQISEAGGRAGALTRQLLAFSRKQVMKPVSLELNGTVSKLEKMLRRIIGEDVELLVSLEESLGKIKADPVQIEQVLMNLAVNARDAMPKGGKLLIETASAEFDDGYIELHKDAKQGKFAMLAVSDTGEGIPPEIKERIFEPFFTTKQKDQGSGLGLSTVYGIIQQMRGHIWVYSEPSQGTIFKVYFPVEQSDDYEKPAEFDQKNLCGEETILLVEDEATVRQFVRRLLISKGYRVVSAADGREGLLQYHKHKESIALVLTDVIMPQMNGHMLANELEEIDPNLKILFMSGYTEDAMVQREALREGFSLITKPFTSIDLLSRIRNMLDEE